jgi:uncharacterized membrane protein
MAENTSPVRLSWSHSSWLNTHSAQWVSAGIIDEPSRARILSGYQTRSAEQTGLMALLLLAVLMFAIGILLLIGYNWARIPAPGKITLIMSSVSLAFGGAAWSFARRHPVAGEVLGLAGVLLFGNAIWLIAQVLHIQGHFPDAFKWWAIGALAAAALIRSKIIGPAAAILLGVWILSESFDDQRSVIAFVTLWLAAVGISYWLSSEIMLYITALAAAAWVMVTPHAYFPATVSIGSVALAGCAFYALSLWHDRSSHMARAWQVTGLVVVLLAFIPLLLAETHRAYGPSPLTWTMFAPALPWLLVALSPLVRWGTRDRDLPVPMLASRVADFMIVVTALTVTLWLEVMISGYGGDQSWSRLSVIAFSVLALALSAALIRKALSDDTGMHLAFGVLFGLAFLLIRWASLIDSMLWSGLMLLVASAGFFGVARLWRDRDRHPIVEGTLS